MISSERAGDLLFTFAHHITDIIENDIYKNEAYVVEPQRFFYTLLHKLRNVLDAASLHVKNLDGKPHYHDSVYLQLRTCLFDAVNLYFVMDADGDKTLEGERIQRIMDDHIRAIWNSAQDEEEKDLIIERFPAYITSDGKFRKDLKKINIIMMHNEVKSDTIRSKIRTMIDLYNIFSKVEHNGQLTFNIIHAHFEPAGAISAKSKIYHALHLIMETIALLVRYGWKISAQDKRFLELIRLCKEI
jgi:hypothetical protein